jgi:hypothetical protein
MEFTMRRATITLPDDLEQAVDAFIDAQPASPSLTPVTQAALREYLAARGYLTTRKVLRIRPAKHPGGDPRASIEHDQHVAEMHQ